MQQQQQQQMMQQQGVQYLTMAQGTEGGAPSLAGPNGQQVIPLPQPPPLPHPPSSFLFVGPSAFPILFLLSFPSRLFTTPANLLPPCTSSPSLTIIHVDSPHTTYNSRFTSTKTANPSTTELVRTSFYAQSTPPHCPTNPSTSILLS